MSDIKLVQELTTSLRNNRIQLDSVNQQISHLDRQSQIAQLTSKELDSYPTDEVWRSCGKAFILQAKDTYITDLKHDEHVIKEEQKSLKIKQNYLETTIEKTVDGLKAVLRQKK